MSALGALYPRKRTFVFAIGMSALGHKRHPGCRRVGDPRGSHCRLAPLVKSWSVNVPLPLVGGSIILTWD